MASQWTDELRAKVIKMYKDADPTAETSTEIIKEIATEIDGSANGVRLVLVQAGVYIKKDAATKPAGKTGEASTGTKRVSKDDAIAELRTAIEAKGATVDDDILSKLTGKAASYFVGVLAA